MAEFFSDELLTSAYLAYRRRAHSAHGVAIVGAFVADVLYPLGDGAYYAFLVALAALLALGLAFWLCRAGVNFVFRDWGVCRDWCSLLYHFVLRQFT
jgi:hypothetical protein